MAKSPKNGNFDNFEPKSLYQKLDLSDQFFLWTLSLPWTNLGQKIFGMGVCQIGGNTPKTWQKHQKIAFLTILNPNFCIKNLIQVTNFLWTLSLSWTIEGQNIWTRECV